VCVVQGEKMTLLQHQATLLQHQVTLLQQQSRRQQTAIFTQTARGSPDEPLVLAGQLDSNGRLWLIAIPTGRPPLTNIQLQTRPEEAGVIVQLPQHRHLITVEIKDLDLV